MLDTRDKAWEFIEGQLDADSCSLKNKDDENETWGPQTWHYGKCELHQLLDQIFGVNSKGEEICTP